MKTAILVAVMLTISIIAGIAGVRSGIASERRYTNLCLKIGKNLSTIEWLYRCGYISYDEMSRATKVMQLKEELSLKEIKSRLDDILKDISDYVSKAVLNNDIERFHQFMSTN